MIPSRGKKASLKCRSGAGGGNIELIWFSTSFLSNVFPARWSNLLRVIFKYVVTVYPVSSVSFSCYLYSYFATSFLCSICLLSSSLSHPYFSFLVNSYVEFSWLHLCAPVWHQPIHRRTKHLQMTERVQGRPSSVESVHPTGVAVPTPRTSALCLGAIPEGTAIALSSAVAC